MRASSVNDISKLIEDIAAVQPEALLCENSRIGPSAASCPGIAHGEIRTFWQRIGIFARLTMWPDMGDGAVGYIRQVVAETSAIVWRKDESPFFDDVVCLLPYLAHAVFQVLIRHVPELASGQVILAIRIFPEHDKEESSVAQVVSEGTAIPRLVCELLEAEGGKRHAFLHLPVFLDADGLHHDASFLELLAMVPLDAEDTEHDLRIDTLGWLCQVEAFPQCLLAHAAISIDA